MAKPLIDDDLWAEIKALLPPPKPRRLRFPGRRPIDDRLALTGIVFVLVSGIPWEMLPQEMGCGSGMTCWRRLRDWHKAGVWERIHRLFLEKLHQADAIDWSRAVVDSGSLRAVGGGEKDGAESDRPRQAGQQTPRAHRRERRAPGGSPHGRQRS